MTDLVDTLGAVLLGPWLVAQGRRVRRDVLRLPEPPGPRAGVETPRGASGRAPLRLLIAGDSSAAGVGAERQALALAGQLPARVAAIAGQPVRWRLVARSGLGVGGLDKLLRAAEAARYDVAVIAIGVNEVTAGMRPHAWRAALDALHATLRERFGVGQVLYAALPPMHRFPALPQPLRGFLGRRARRLDRALAEWTAVADGARRAPLPDFDTAAVASDGFHPGEAAYRAWAESLAPEVAAAGTGSTANPVDRPGAPGESVDQPADEPVVAAVSAPAAPRAGGGSRRSRRR